MKEKEIFLSAKDISFKYLEKNKRYVLKDVSLEVEKGKIVVILGSSGCGKSTFASICTGLYPSNGGKLFSGTIEIEGKNLQNISLGERTKLLTMMFQNPDLQFCMDTLRKELIFCLENICTPKECMDETIEEFSKRFNVKHLLDQKLHSLSGGEKQKAALCCLMLINSKGIFLDEPFANVDEAGAKELISMLKQQNKEKKTTIIVIDHRLDHWLQTADEFIILGEEGHVKARGITRENMQNFKEIFEEEGLPYEKPASEEIAADFMQKAAKTESAVIFKEVSIKRGKSDEYLLKDASGSFPRGGITAILGPSGSGKTTLFSACLKEKPYAGSIMVNGRDLKKIKSKDLYKIIGTVFQNPGNQFISTEVLKELEESLRIWRPELKERERREAGENLLDNYGLKKYSRYSPYMLSQGQQRRLAVLSILAGNQQILLLDEPTYGQDNRSIEAIMGQIKELVKERNLTVIFTTHHTALALKYADKIYEIKGEKLRLWEY